LTGATVSAVPGTHADAFRAAVELCDDRSISPINQPINPYELFDELPGRPVGANEAHLYTGSPHHRFDRSSELSESRRSSVET
jgi:hypothetical protein